MNTESAFSIQNMTSELRQVPFHLRGLVRVKSNRATYDPDSEIFQNMFEVRPGIMCSEACTK